MRERTQIKKIKGEKDSVITDATEIQRLIGEYFLKIYSNKLESLQEMEK
jgi:hypothetical protein